MKRKPLVRDGILMFVLIVFSWTFFLFSLRLEAAPGSKAQEQEHKPIVEKVTVTNVEVPVRVLNKGIPVTDLTREDFTLYENKKKMEINGFFLKRKKISFTPTTPVAAEAGPAAPSPARTFVLVFNLVDYNRYFQEAMDYLFEHIFRDTDRLLVFANDKTREFPHLDDKTKIKQQIIGDLKEESQKARRRLVEYINRIETYLKVHDFRQNVSRPGTQQAEQLIDFLKKYQLAWNEYKTNYLTPRVDRFYYFARYLENLKSEKWVFNFYQFELFPRIRLGSDTMLKLREVATGLTGTNNATMVAQGRLMDTILNQVMSDLSVNKGFPNEEISKLFYKVDATFYSFFIRSTYASFLQDFDYREISSDIEQVLKGITELTGGKNITSNDLVKSLETVSDLEDAYYIITYAPKDPKKVGKLKIKVNNKRYDVLYDDNFRADYINDYLNKLEEKIKTPDIKFKDFSYKRKTLTFTVTDYLVRMLDKETKPVGRMQVRIRLKDREGKSWFDQAKMLTAYKTEMKISLEPFKTIPKGEYNLLIDVKDLLTGKEANINEDITLK
jgi:hypothetical protein